MPASSNMKKITIDLFQPKYVHETYKSWAQILQVGLELGW